MRRFVIILAALAVTTSACSAGSKAATSTTSSASTRTTVTTAPTGGFLVPEVKFGTGTVGAPSPTTSVPTERGTRPIDPSNDAGQEVIIAKGGYLLPEWLVADYQLPITWTNLSEVPQQIIFDAAPVHSPVIAPGATFSWTSPGFAISLTYHTANGHHARLTLQNPNSP